MIWYFGIWMSSLGFDTIFLAVKMDPKMYSFKKRCSTVGCFLKHLSFSEN